MTAEGAIDSRRRLILLRHAKSDWPAGVDDLRRPLADRGIGDATRAGPLLADLAVPDAVLCSPARRTRETWQLVGEAFTPPPPLRVVPELYGADAEELLAIVAMIPGGVRTAVVVGHEPTMSTTATALAGPGSAADDLARLRAKFPTCGIAVLELAGDWGDLAPGGAVLTRFLVPRG
jgi:phosphohistidine phosphatase